MVQTELNRHQAIAANRIRNANPKETRRSTFRDRLQAHFDKSDSERATTAGADADATTANSSSRRLRLSNSVDVTKEKGGRSETVSSKLNKNSSLRLVTSAAKQEQSSGNRGIGPTIEVVIGSTRKSTLDEPTTTKASELVTAPDLIATLDLNAARLAPIQPGPMVSTACVLSDSNENIPTILNSSNTSTGAKASASLSANQQQSVAPAADSAAWPGSSSGPQSIEAGDDMTVTDETDAATFQKIDSEVSSSELDDSRAYLRPKTYLSNQVNENAGQSEAPGNLVSAVGTGVDTKKGDTKVDTRTDASVELANWTIGSQPLALSRLQSASTVDNQIPTSPPDISVQSDRYLNNTAGSKLPLQSAKSANASNLSRTPKPFSSRLSSSDDQAQNSSQVQPHSPSFISAHAPNLSLIAEGTTIGSTLPKITCMISSDSRLQDTFAALELGTKNGTSANNRGRIGHMQAEVGFQDPALGWIGIRAEGSGGAVHATLIPQSSDAAQELSGHIAGLHRYLADNHTPVETLTLASIGANGQHSAGQDAGQGMHQGTGQNSEQSKHTEPVPQINSMTRPTFNDPPGEPSISDDALIRRTSRVGFGGAHISVIA